MIKAIIVDDEELPREQISYRLKKDFPAIQLAASCANGATAYQAIHQHKPDVLFLDIQMPGMSGFDLLQKIPEPGFEVIFVTSYDHYGINAIRFSALDYLLKPLDKEEFRKAIHRFYEKKNIHSETRSRIENYLSNIRSSPEEYKLAVATTEGTFYFKTDEIIRCEADSNYTRIFFTKRKALISSKTLKDYDDLLTEYNFIRTHRSHLVNRKHIKLLVNDGYLVMSDSSEVEVSRRKYYEVKNLLSGNN